MALLSIVFGRLPGLSQKTVGVLPVDVFTEETVMLSAATTDHPVETGGTITDHIKTDPLTLRVRGTVRAARRSLAFNILQTLHERRQPIFVVTGLQTFTNMAITRLEIPREARTADSLLFTAEFKKIIFATSQTSDATAATNGAENTAPQTQSRGSQTPAQCTPAQVSAATATTEAAGGVGGSFLSRAF